LAVPTQFNITSNPAALAGAASYCAGGAGVEFGLDGSQVGITYRLYVDGDPVGTTVAGNGAAISFGNQTLAGIYSVRAIDDNDTESLCEREMTGSITLNINPLPNATLTLVGNENICCGQNTQIDITFISGTGPYDVTITDGVNTPNVVLNGISGAPYEYIPVDPYIPAWVNDGTPDTEYTYTIVTITDSNGCVNTNIGSVSITVWKRPETGPQYHIPNTFGE
jgi:hypothetical protein